MSPEPPPTVATLIARIETSLLARADPAAASPMSSYMRDQFRFLGVKSPGQKAAWREASAEIPNSLPEDVVVSAAKELWDRPEREFQYLGCTLVNRHGASTAASPAFLATVGDLITTKSWWDTVDALATHAVGDLVRRFPELRVEMDRWLDDDMWLARSALLHMNRWKAAIDRAWLFAACLRRASDQDFFVRKAIGWALREYSKVDMAAVENFVAAHEQQLSGLSRREALMWRTRQARKSS